MSSRSITLLSSLALKVQHGQLVNPSLSVGFKHTNFQHPDAWRIHTPIHLLGRNHRPVEHYRSGLCAGGMFDRLAFDGTALFLISFWGVVVHLPDGFLILGSAVQALGPLGLWTEKVDDWGCSIHIPSRAETLG